MHRHTCTTNRACMRVCAQSFTHPRVHPSSQADLQTDTCGQRELNMFAWCCTACKHRMTRNMQFHTHTHHTISSPHSSGGCIVMHAGGHTCWRSDCKLQIHACIHACTHTYTHNSAYTYVYRHRCKYTSSQICEYAIFQMGGSACTQTGQQSHAHT